MYIFVPVGSSILLILCCADVNSPYKRLDFTCLLVALVFHWLSFQRHRSLWCFTGYYFVDDKRSHAAWRSSCAAVYTLFQFVFAIFAPPASCRFFDDVGRSGASLATDSLTRSAPMQRAARPARPFTHFSNSFLLFLALPASAGWLAGWLAG